MSSTAHKMFIEAGGRGVVPQMDAPTSASNSGERLTQSSHPVKRVTIRYQQSSISLPVTPDTSPMDIMYSSANLMTQELDPRSSVLVEWYFTLGLERRLRRYERVRDVLNSWDRDSQHSLLIIPEEFPGSSKDLDVDTVPRSHDPPPGLVNFPLYHSQRPGKWSKRLVTLHDGGQLFYHKKQDAKPSDKDSVNLCNLSDFDLYDVTDKDMRKSLRPPKKHCFAIKSQQKHSVFLNTENFVHFFSTDSADLAQDFQECVHEWRSWYLVNKKVDLGKKERALHGRGEDIGEKPAHNHAGLARSGTHRLKVSVDETPYTIGKFEPFINMDRFDKPIEDFGKDFLPDRNPAEHQVTHRPREGMHTHAHAGARTGRSVSEPQQQSTRSPSLPSQSQPQHLVDPFRKDEFKSSGLLGKGYEGRKNLAETRKSDEQPTEGPFTGGLLEQQRQQKQQAAMTQEQQNHHQAAIPRRSNTARHHHHPQQSHQHHHPPPPPSSSAHAAHGGQLSRSRTVSRPTTSDSASYAKQRQKPQPLLDINPSLPELPAPWREKRGHGVKAPEGAPLISMATDSRVQWQPPGVPAASASPANTSPVTSPPPSRSGHGLARSGTTRTTRTTHSNPGAALSRSASSAQPASSKVRSQSTAPATGTSGRRVASHDQQVSATGTPPVPALPKHHSSRHDDDEDVPLINFVDRARGRDPNPKGLDTRSRSGTLKQV